VKASAAGAKLENLPVPDISLAPRGQPGRAMWACTLPAAGLYAADRDRRGFKKQIEPRRHKDTKNEKLIVFLLRVFVPFVVRVVSFCCGS